VGHHGVVEHRRDLGRHRREAKATSASGMAPGRARAPPTTGRGGEDEHEAPQAAIQGFFGPLASAMEPRTGESTASTSPAAAVA
jgi:hypothetical protein